MKDVVNNTSWHLARGAKLDFNNAAVLAFSEVMSDYSNLGRFQLSLYDTGRYMRLDSAAQRALNVLKQRTDANDNFSLYGLMNYGRTVMARRLLKVGKLDSCAFNPSAVSRSSLTLKVTFRSG